MEKTQEYFDFILPLIKKAGQLLLKAHAQKIQVEIKSSGDLVTKYDILIEDILINRLKERYPTHKMIGEETFDKTKETPILTDCPTWIIDPIDGTTNFTRKIPMCGISVGLCIEKQQSLGIIYNPFLNELYTAMKDRGAYLNGERIQTSGVEDIKKSVFCSEISLAGASEHFHSLYMTRTSHLLKHVKAMRSYGCPVLSLCYVACGKIDAYQCDGLFPWDAAAGTLIVTEAGGCVVDTTGKEKFDLMNPNFLAVSMEKLGEQYLEVERQADQEMSEKYCQ